MRIFNGVNGGYYGKYVMVNGYNGNNGNGYNGNGKRCKYVYGGYYGKKES